MLGGAMAVAIALVMVLATAPMAGEGGWKIGDYGYETFEPATSSPETKTEEMAPAVPSHEMNKEEMTPSASEPQKEEEMAPADSGSRHERVHDSEKCPLSSAGGKPTLLRRLGGSSKVEKGTGDCRCPFFEERVENPKGIGEESAEPG